jgi:hypothetical protein
MFISIGWFCFIGGVLGAIRVASAKKFYKSDFANSDGVIADDDYKTEVLISPMKRWLIVGICVVVAIIGAWKIHTDHAWNPFHSSSMSDPYIKERLYFS